MKNFILLMLLAGGFAAHAQVTLNSGVSIGASAGGGGGTTYSAGNGISISGSTISAAAGCVQSAVQSGDTIAAAAGYFATTCTIPANTLQAGSTIDLWVAGVMSDGTVQSTNKFGIAITPAGGSTAALLTPTQGPYLAASQTNVGWTLVGRIICTAVGSAGTIEAQGEMHASTGTASSGSIYGMVNSAPVSIDTTIANTLSVAIVSGNNAAGDSATMRQFIAKFSN